MERKTESLSSLNNEERLEAYQSIIDGCSHLFSKGSLQAGKVKPLLSLLVKLAHKDPYFLAHFTAWSQKQKSRDLKVASIFANSLSIANGEPFSAKSKYKKPNLRYVSASSLLNLDPKMVERIRELGNFKFGVPRMLGNSKHLSTALRTAIKKYLKYREANIHMIKGIKKAGLGDVYKQLYRSVHLAPSEKVAQILRWQQKDKKIEIDKSTLDFSGMKPIQIAKKIREEKLSILGVIGALPKITPVIAVALLEQATGNQALIMRKTFEDAGILNDKEVKVLYASKIKQAQTTIDRSKNLSKGASEGIKTLIKQTKAELRKSEMKGLGSIFLHLDFSSSMDDAIDFAKERGAIIAEAIHEPKKNFHWGGFNNGTVTLPLPTDFVEDEFQAILFGKITYGCTDAFACYPKARNAGCAYDIFVTDGGHNMGLLSTKIANFHINNPTLSKPKGCLIVDFGRANIIKNAYEENGIPVSVIKPAMLTESAVVGSSLKSAIKGPLQVIDEIMATPLPDMPEWYEAV